MTWSNLENILYYAACWLENVSSGRRLDGGVDLYVHLTSIEWCVGVVRHPG